MASPNIESYMHCAACVDEYHALPLEKKVGLSHRDYARIEVGWTAQGLEVWCFRHDRKIAHIDFQGRKVRLI